MVVSSENETSLRLLAEDGYSVMRFPLPESVSLEVLADSFNPLAYSPPSLNGGLIAMIL